MDSNEAGNIISNLLSSMNPNYKVGLITFRKNSSVISNGIK